MNLNDYRVVANHVGQATLYAPNGDPILITENVGLDTLLHLALEHDLKRKA